VPELIGDLHEKLVFGRRTRVLTGHLSALIPPHARVLDVGCGDGTIDCLIMQQRPDLTIEGIEVLTRPNAHIPVKSYDGATLPYPDRSFDVVMFVDVLHHTLDPLALLREAARVGKMIVLKDHMREGFLANTTLRFMDWFGNAHFGVVLPYNYWSKAQWTAALDALGLNASHVRQSLGLYPAPASWIFDRRLQFVARIESVDATSANSAIPDHQGRMAHPLPTH
jgi:SAM-dependent methyltransferase